MTVPFSNPDEYLSILIAEQAYSCSEKDLLGKLKALANSDDIGISDFAGRALREYLGR